MATTAKNRKSNPTTVQFAKNCKSIKPFTLEYAGAKLGVSLPIIYKLIRNGKLRSYKIGVKGHRVSDQAIADCIALLEAEKPAIAPRPCGYSAASAAPAARSEANSA